VNVAVGVRVGLGWVGVWVGLGWVGVRVGATVEVEVKVAVGVCVLVGAAVGEAIWVGVWVDAVSGNLVGVAVSAPVRFVAIVAVMLGVGAVVPLPRPESQDETPQALRTMTNKSNRIPAPIRKRRRQDASVRRRRA
jgi:hypothetical protein